MSVFSNGTWSLLKFKGGRGRGCTALQGLVVGVVGVKNCPIVYTIMLISGLIGVCLYQKSKYSCFRSTFVIGIICRIRLYHLFAYALIHEEQTSKKAAVRPHRATLTKLKQIKTSKGKGLMSRKYNTFMKFPSHDVSCMTKKLTVRKEKVQRLYAERIDLEGNKLCYFKILTAKKLAMLFSSLTQSFC